MSWDVCIVEKVGGGSECGRSELTFTVILVAREMVAELVYRGFSDSFKAVNSLKDSTEFNASKLCMWKPTIYMPCTKVDPHSSADSNQSQQRK